MKRTFKIFLMAICLVAFMAPAFADNDKPIQVKELPAKAQTILSQHFKNQKVALATIEVGLLEKNYDVVLNNGTKVEFDKNGNVTEVINGYAYPFVTKAGRVRSSVSSRINNACPNVNGYGYSNWFT